MTVVASAADGSNVVVSSTAAFVVACFVIISSVVDASFTVTCLVVDTSFTVIVSVVDPSFTVTFANRKNSNEIFYLCA